MRFQSLLIVLVALFILPTSAFALSLGDAKGDGLVGETPSGYLQAVSPNPSAEVKSLIAEINQRRKEEYLRISSKRGAPLNSVEQLAGKEAIERAPGGHYVMDASGKWIRK